MAQQDDDLLTPLETATMLGVAPSTLPRWRRFTRQRGEQHGPPWVEIGANTVKYRRGAIKTFIRAREQRTDG